MLTDRYDNTLTTQSNAARDAYIDGVDRVLAADGGADEAFERAIAADPDFALAHVGLARILQVGAQGPAAAAAIARARELADPTTKREQGHIAMLSHLIGGKGPAAYKAALVHLADHPRDVLVAQPLCGVFGLIGFSGLAGRESEQLAFMAKLAPNYGEDWWFETQHAFAMVEAGQTAPATVMIERSLANNPKSANAAHIRAHVYYEAGEIAAGLSFLDQWRQDYDRRGALHCHIAWHVALWSMLSGDMERGFAVIDADVGPGKAWGPPLNVMTDTASFLHRAEIAGAPRQDDRWRELSAFALKIFPNPGIAFGDTHAALAHAIAGETSMLERLISEPTGPAGEVVSKLAEAFAAFARQDWAATIALLTPVMGSHERVGGSRAQRDLIEFTMVTALLRAGRADDARLMLESRRPLQAATQTIAGLKAA